MLFLNKLTAFFYRFPYILLLSGLFVNLIFLLLWVPEYLQNYPMLNQDTLAHFTYSAKIIQGGLKEALSLTPDDKFYPPLFHIFVYFVHFVSTLLINCKIIPAGLNAFGSGISIASSINISWILISGIIFPICLVVFIKQIFKEVKLEFKPALYFIIPVLSLIFPCFPGMLLESGTLYPYTLSSAILPLFLAATLNLFTKIDSVYSKELHSKRNLIFAVILLFIVFVLIILAQPRILFIGVLILIPFIISRLFYLRRNYSEKTDKLFIAVSIIFVLGFILTIVYAFKKLNKDLLFSPELWFKDHGIDMSRNDALITTTTFSSNIPPNITTGINFALTSIIIISILTVVFRRYNYTKWLVVSLIICQITLFIVASGDTVFEKIFAAPWYKEFIRINPTLPIIAVSLIALALTYLSVRFVNIGYIFVLASVLLLFINPPLYNLKNFIEFENNLEGQTNSKTPALLNSEKINDMKEVAKLTDESSLIINDPYNGSGYLYSIYNRKVLFDTMNPKYGSIPRQWMVIDGFKEKDPAKMKELVCKSPNLVNNMYFFDMGDSYTNKFEIYKQYLPLHNSDNIKNYLEAGNLSIIKKFKNNFTLYKVNC